jgi:hypothetical protein
MVGDLEHPAIAGAAMPIATHIHLGRRFAQHSEI